MHNTLYHITPSANAELIVLEGIKPYKDAGELNRNGLSGDWVLTEEEWRKDVVWLTHDPDYILFCQGTHWWCNNNSAVVLEIDVSDLDVKPREEARYKNHKEENVEHLYFGQIDPHRIKSIKPFTDFKEPEW